MISHIIMMRLSIYIYICMSLHGLIILLYFRSRLIFLLIKPVDPIGGVTGPEGLDVVLERPLVLEIGAAGAVPELPAVLLVRPPVAFDGEALGALPAGEGLRAVLALVVRLEGSEVLERLRARVVDVVLAPLRAAVARQPQHCRGLSPFQRVWPFSELGSVSPHVHLLNAP